MSTIRKVHLYPNGNMLQGEVLQHELGEVAFFVAPSVDEKDRVNQDSLAIIELDDDSLVFAIADGAGAHRGGAEASSGAIAAIVDTLSHNGHHHSWESALLDAIDKANASVVSLGIGAATTLIAIHVNEEGARPFHVGDSSALVVGQRGKLKFQTLSHSPIGYAVEAGILDEETAIHHEDRNIVSNLLGTEQMHVQIGGRVGLSRHDTLVLASDGLFDNMLTDEVNSVIRTGPIDSALSNLVLRTHERMLRPEAGDPSKFDDLSIILFRPKSESQKRAEG